jgi:hypothetical protein
VVHGEQQTHSTQNQAALDVQVVSRRPIRPQSIVSDALLWYGRKVGAIPGEGSTLHSLTSFMKKLTAEQLREYATDPLATDEKVRRWCNVPEDRYYTVAMWPEERAGEVRVTDLHRVVRVAKISKSNQASAES